MKELIQADHACNKCMTENTRAASVDDGRELKNGTTADQHHSTGHCISLAVGSVHLGTRLRGTLCAGVDPEAAALYPLSRGVRLSVLRPHCAYARHPLAPQQQ
eukprot:scpid96343/ scgid34227/ 